MKLREICDNLTIMNLSCKELKTVLDEYIKRCIVVPGNNPESWKIRVSPKNYHKAKYSCTTDEKDFHFENGVLTYKGI